MARNPEYIPEHKIRELLRAGEQVREQKKARELAKFLVDGAILRARSGSTPVDFEV